MWLHKDAGVHPTAPVESQKPSSSSSDPSPGRRASESQTGANDYSFYLRPSLPLPIVDLSRTPAQRMLSQQGHRIALRIVSNHFHQFVWYFRFGISCFVALLFIPNGLARDLILTAMVPAHQSLIATTLFLSRDMLGLLARNYDFWFATIMNSLNWIAFAVVLGDKRVLASLLGWYGMQIVITVDASYRTFPTSVATMRLAIPIVLVMFGFVSFRSIDGAQYFAVRIGGRLIYDAADMMGFTSSTLAILLAKIVYLKRRHVVPPARGAGYLRIPCALIKVRLCLEKAAESIHTQQSSRLASSPSSPAQAAESIPPSPCNRKPVLSAAAKQQMRLSPLKVAYIDARRTLLPFSWWKRPPPLVVRYQRPLWFVVVTIGAMGHALLVLHTFQNFLLQMGGTFQNFLLQIASTASSTATAECTASYLENEHQDVVVAAGLCSAIFCGVWALFCQRDLLRLLVTNFDYVFSIAQIIAFQLCVLDMVCWELGFSLATMTWSIWLVWALTIDALTPLVKNSIFRFSSKLAAIVLASVLFSGLCTTYVVIFMENNGYRYRTIVNLTISSTHTFTLTTRSVLLGRAATISLWCTRQVVALFSRREGELHLIRGLVEYESPYGLIPPKLNKQIPALMDET